MESRGFLSITYDEFYISSGEETEPENLSLTAPQERIEDLYSPEKANPLETSNIENPRESIEYPFVLPVSKKEEEEPVSTLQEPKNVSIIRNRKRIQKQRIEQEPVQDTYYQQVMNDPELRVASRIWMKGTSEEDYGEREYSLLWKAFDNHFRFEKYLIEIRGQYKIPFDFNLLPDNYDLEEYEQYEKPLKKVLDMFHYYIDQGPFIQVQYTQNIEYKRNCEKILYRLWYILCYLANPIEYMNIKEPQYQKICRLVPGSKRSKTEEITQMMSQVEIRGNDESEMERQQRLFGICKWFYYLVSWKHVWDTSEGRGSDVLLLDVNDSYNYMKIVKSDNVSVNLLRFSKIEINIPPIFTLYEKPINLTSDTNFSYIWNCKDKTVSRSVFKK